MAVGDQRAVTGPDAPPLSIRLVRVQVALRTRHRTAHGVEARRDVVIVEWTGEDGVVGWSECPTLELPGYSSETTERAWTALVSELAPAALVGRAPLLAGVVASTAALRDARLDAGLRATGRSLSDHVGATRRSLERCSVIAALGVDLDEIARRAADAVVAGARMVKVKIAPGHDAEPLRAVRSVIGDVALAADANGSYADPGDLAAVDRLGLRYLEQPFPPRSTWDELVALQRPLRTPIALDESLVSSDAVVAAVSAGAVQVVSVKPARLGGLDVAAAVVEHAAERGLDAFVGGMLELGIGRAATSAIAAMDGCTIPTDLGPSADYVDEDVCEPVVTDDQGRLQVPDGVGIGRRPDPVRLAAVTVDEVLLGR